jgi:hypothetical protein
MALPGQVFTESDVLDAAWRRVSQWYRGGEWGPQPELAEWELHQERLLAQLGDDLAGGDYGPQAMPLIPYSKKKGQLRHYCQPTVRDQVAFTLFGILLAPVLENSMKRFSFGNRWFRRMAPPLKNDDKWGLRPWSLADAYLYQPYRRAHGLFRRVASWTVDAMLKTTSPAEGPVGARVLQEDYPEGLIPAFARPRYWKSIRRRSQSASWARFDLRLAFPSVRLSHLHTALLEMVDEALPAQPADPLAQDLSEVQKLIDLEDSLKLYSRRLRKLLLERETVRALVDYLLRMLAGVRYRPFNDSDKLFFPVDPSEGPNSRPHWLPLGDGAEHPGLPTGLTLSPLLLNAYLHRIDRAIGEWMRDGERTLPVAFLRFADDMILLADSPRRLAQGMDVLVNAMEPQDGSDRDLNLRLNFAKVEPAPVKALTSAWSAASGATPQSFSHLLTADKGKLLKELERSAVRPAAKDPFITDLVERLSDLGAEKATDLLDGKARVRLTRLQEIVVFKPDAQAVPRETQLVFAANQLVRAWLPEQGFRIEHALLMDIRRAVAEALRGAPDKPRLWRSVWRAAVRRPTSTAGVEKRQFVQADTQAMQWLRSVAADFRSDGNGEWARPEEDGEREGWPRLWAQFASFHRAALWRALADVARDVQEASVRQRDFGDAFSTEGSWVFRAFDESTLPRAVPWLESAAHTCFATLYGQHDLVLSEQEAMGLTLATLAFLPRSIVITKLEDLRRGHAPLVGAVAEIARDRGPQWRLVAGALQHAPSSDQGSVALEALVWLSQSGGKDDADAAQRLVSAWRDASERLLLARKFRWEAFLVTRLRQAAARELAGFDDRLRAAKRRGVEAISQELRRYDRARQTWLELDGFSR